MLKEPTRHPSVQGDRGAGGVQSRLQMLVRGRRVSGRPSKIALDGQTYRKVALHRSPSVAPNEEAGLNLSAETSYPPSSACWTRTKGTTAALGPRCIRPEGFHPSGPRRRASRHRAIRAAMTAVRPAAQSLLEHRRGKRPGKLAPEVRRPPLYHLGKAWGRKESRSDSMATRLKWRQTRPHRVHTPSK